MMSAVALGVVAALSFAMKMPPAIIELHRNSREMALTFLYEGLVAEKDPVALFDDKAHQDFYFPGAGYNLTEALDDMARDLDLTLPPPVAAPEPPKSASPLMEARARRAQRTVPRSAPAFERAAPPIPEGAEPVGEEEQDADHRGLASAKLCRRLLEGVGGRRPELERAVLALATPQLQEELPAIDCGVLLLFMSELHDGLPLAVACSEAVALSKAYSGAHHTMVNGVLAAYAQDMKSRGLEVDTS